MQQMPDHQNTKRAVFYTLAFLIIFGIAALLIIQLKSMEKTLSNLSQPNTLIPNNQEIITDEEVGSIDELELPVVFFTREGNLNDIEKVALTKYLIDPFIAYRNEFANDKMLVMAIEVPADEGDEYLVEAFYYDGTNEGFVYGKKNIEYRYWTPDCLNGCQFSEEFKKNFPGVIEEYNRVTPQ